MKSTMGMIGLSAAVLLASAHLCGALPSTSFTYQGQLKDGGVPAQGDYDVLFSLFNSAGGGALIAGPLAFDGAGGNLPIPVVNGLFQAELDFGDVFDGTALWLQMEVRPHGDGSYTLLNPRQALTATPVALYALSGPGGSGPWTTDLSHIHNTNAGNVGIGTVTPAAKLHVTGDIRGDGPLGIVAHNPNNPEAIAALGWFNDVARIRIGGNGAGSIGGLDIQKSGDRSLMRIDHDGNAWFRGGLDVSGGALFREGNVGIGTASPASKLSVVSEAGTSAAVSGSGYFGVSGSASDPGGYGGTFGGSGFLGGGQALLSWGDSHLVGSVGIGTTEPEVKLHIEGGTDSAPGGGGFLVTGDTGGRNISIDNDEIMARNNGSAASLFLNANGGNVGIGTSSPAYELDVGGRIRPRSGIYFNGALGPYPSTQGGNLLSFGAPGVSEDQLIYIGTVGQGRFVFLDSPGGGDTGNPDLLAEDFISNSDERLKRNIEPLEDALSKVLQLHPIRFQWDGSKVDPVAGAGATHNAKTRPGFSAQQVAEVIPEVVSYTPQLDLYGVSYGGLVPYLVEAIKEQQRTIDQLQQDVERLQRGREIASP